MTFGPDRSQSVRFTAYVGREAGFVTDDDFHYDAVLTLNGDFPTDAERLAYAEAVAAALNAAVIPDGKDKPVGFGDSR
jgi:hypothetical protein